MTPITDSAACRRHHCPCNAEASSLQVTRRELLQTCGLGVASAALTELSWPALAAQPAADQPGAELRRCPLVVKPVFTYPLPTRQRQTSWRNWGGVQSQADVDQDAARIRGELDRLRAEADFPIEFLPLAVVRRADELRHVADVAGADVILVYAAGDGGGDLMAAMNPLGALGKDRIFFVRHKSGPLYYWYEGIMARYLHQHTDVLAVPGVDYDDVVVDRLDEVLWRLRALGGLKNARGTKIIAIGRAGGWGPSGKQAPERAKEKWRLEVTTVAYDELAALMKEAFADVDTVQAARKRAETYLQDPGVKLEVERSAVDHAFLLEHVFRALMARVGAQAITISGCMRTVMPIAQTSACLALSVLNDAGYLAFCESDFVVIPAGILLAQISGRPQFLNDPTYPHDGVITLAHCTAPRRMDGRTLDPARILTHFESDYGAAPKVEFRKGQRVTSIIPDFAHARWVGLAGEIVDVPFLPICRSQMDVAHAVSDRMLATAMPGFHWETIYGDYLREVGYALKKTPIKWERLT
jgi:hypothetical protein